MSHYEAAKVLNGVKLTSLTAVLAVLMFAPGCARAQIVELPILHTPLPSCSAAMCEEEIALLNAIDAVLRRSEDCQDRPPMILRTLHWAPYTEGSEAAVTQASSRGIPSSPVAMRTEHILTSRRYLSDIRLVDSADVLAGAVPDDSCLLVLSPPSWRGPDMVRVEIAEWRMTPFHVAQRFVYLRRDGQEWSVERFETGMRS